MIKARTQLARAGEGASPEALADIEQGVEYIEDLLAHYGGAAEVDTQLMTLDCNIAVNTAIQMLDYRARQIGADLQVSLDTVPLTAELRAGAVRQVLVNLVQNALDAVEGHDRRVVRVQTRGEAEHISLVVVDSGVGVDPEIRGRMFRPFVTSKPPGKGTGLGLFIARELVEHAGGQLIIEPTAEGGTRAEVRLPRVRS
jgi:C4-dicarboxylate-specific signal transduction histidine kinase